jgi:hypothetical protein
MLFSFEKGKLSFITINNVKELVRCLLPEKVASVVKLINPQVAKCKQNSILSAIQNTKSLTIADLIAEKQQMKKMVSLLFNE